MKRLKQVLQALKIAVRSTSFVSFGLVNDKVIQTGVVDSRGLPRIMAFTIMLCERIIKDCLELFDSSSEEEKKKPEYGAYRAKLVTIKEYLQKSHQLLSDYGKGKKPANKA